MRMRTRKLCGGKLLAFVLAFALVLPFAGGAKVQALAEDDPILFAVDGNKTNINLEIGDTFTLNIGLNSAVDSVTGLEGDLELPSEYFTILEVIAANSDEWNATSTDGASDNIKHISVCPQKEPVKGVDVSASTVLVQVKVEVKKAVASTKDIKLSGMSVIANSTESVVLGSEQTITLTNSVTSHKVDLIVPEKLRVPVGGVQDPELNQVEMPITIGDTNTGFNGIHININYDKTKLVYKGYSLSDAVRKNSGGIQIMDVRVSDDGLAIALSTAKDITLQKGALLLTLTFTAASGASAGDADVTIIPSIATDSSSVINQSDVEMTASFKGNCAVEFFKGYDYGDVNMDGSIDLIDATYILQGYNGIRTLTDAQKKLADVNKSNTVTLVDALLIMKYYNGTISSFN